MDTEIDEGNGTTRRQQTFGSVHIETSATWKENVLKNKIEILNVIHEMVL